MPSDKFEFSSQLSAKAEKKFLDQFASEFNLCYDSTQTKRIRSLKRLKLFNNQRRDEAKVGDPLLFAIHQTVLANLYADRLSVVFGANEEGDAEVAENLTALAENDYRVMEKDILDYEWDWDACFFGEGYMLQHEFDRQTKTPIAELWDPMATILDPRRSSINGNQVGAGAAMFFGREVTMSKAQMIKSGNYFNLHKIRKDKDLKSLTSEASLARRQAKGMEVSDLKEEALTENYEYKIVQWFTHVDGKKYLTAVANNRNLIIRYQELNVEKWPLLERRIFPMSHGDVVSIPDLVEDKQRARAIMINLGMDSAIADLYSMYLFDKRKFANNQNFDFEFNKWIPVKGSVQGAAEPLQKSLFHQQVNLILNMLDTAAQKAVATPEVAQGVQPRVDRTLGETREVLAGKDTRHSLGAKIFGWSERRFWQQHYFIYKRSFKEELDKKVIRIQGPLAPAWRELTKDNVIAKVDPDVSIEVASIAEAERIKKFREFAQFAQIVIQDPTVNRRFTFRKLGQLNGLKKQTMVLMFPATIDEMRAEDENLKINKKELPKVNPLDEDIIHLEIHNKAADNKVKLVHCEAHKQMMMYKKEHPEQFPQEQMPMINFKPVGAPGAEPRSPQPAGRTAPTPAAQPAGEGAAATA